MKKNILLEITAEYCVENNTGIVKVTKILEQAYSWRKFVAVTCQTQTKKLNGLHIIEHNKTMQN